MRPARPTLRALREDLKLPLPSARESLDELDHPILAKAREHFADDGAGHERIRSIDDEVLFKVKVQRWRGAFWTDEDLPWLIAAGRREDGSPDDFYSALETTARAARAHYNANNRQPLSTTPYVGRLLPDTRTTVIATNSRPVPGSSAISLRLSGSWLVDHCTTDMSTPPTFPLSASASSYAPTTAMRPMLRCASPPQRGPRLRRRTPSKDAVAEEATLPVGTPAHADGSTHGVAPARRTGRGHETAGQSHRTALASVGPVGLEPTTNGLKVHCSAN